MALACRQERNEKGKKGREKGEEENSRRINLLWSVVFQNNFFCQPRMDPVSHPQASNDHGNEMADCYFGWMGEKGGLKLLYAVMGSSQRAVNFLFSEKLFSLLSLISPASKSRCQYSNLT